MVSPASNPMYCLVYCCSPTAFERSPEIRLNDSSDFNVSLHSRPSPPVTMAGVSELSVPNKEEGYDLHGILTVKHEDSKSVWVLCHGLCSSCQGTVPRFVSEELDANTFRQVLRKARSGAAAFTAVRS